MSEIELCLIKIYENLTGNYVQTSHFELNKFQYDMTRNYAKRFNVSIDDVLNIQKDYPCDQ